MRRADTDTHTYIIRHSLHLPLSLCATPMRCHCCLWSAVYDRSHSCFLPSIFFLCSFYESETRLSNAQWNIRVRDGKSWRLCKRNLLSSAHPKKKRTQHILGTWMPKCAALIAIIKYDANAAARCLHWKIKLNLTFFPCGSLIERKLHKKSDTQS